MESPLIILIVTVATPSETQIAMASMFLRLYVTWYESMIHGHDGAA